jgi:hypothetical protein
MNVLIIPEDFLKDQYILKPIIRAMLKTQGKIAKVSVCQNPRLRGIDQALNWEQIRAIIDQYKYRVDLFMLCVDRDGVESRKDILNRLENQAISLLSDGKLFLAENAHQEIEVWVLAGHHNLPTNWAWADIRAEIHPKETYFRPFAEQRGVLNEWDEGRKVLAEEAARQYHRIRQLCEEVADLESRIP